CSLTNLTALSSCLCLNIQAESKIARCVVTNCNYTELVKVEKAQYELCYGEPEPSRRSSILAVTIILACLVIIFVGLRCWSRYTISKEFWWDDWILLLATVFFLALQAVNIWGVEIGFGVHVWNVNPDNNVKLYQYEWIYEIFYAVTTTTTKTSILLLYYRIFPQDWLRRTVFVGCVYMVIHGLIFFFVIVFQCRPIALVYDKSLEGTCLDIHAVVFAGSVLSMIEDIATISLPIPSILKLRLPLKKKLQVVLMMSVGLIAVIASMVRMKFAVNFYYSIDINWDDYGIAILSTIELALSIICVCFPAVKLLFSK
ncbi:hypothetical protein N431DRAFT_317320, partial [Stipitochalara longipes BDJ]